MQLVPSRSELMRSVPGLLLVVLPVVAVSELVYWIESGYVQATFGVPAPVIPIMLPRS